MEAGADFLACETLPSLPEAEALLALMGEFDVEAWLSFTLRDGGHISDGTPLAQVATLSRAQPLVAAIGVNCVPLELVSPSLEALGKATDTPLIAYPNSGESYDAVTKTWGRPRRGTALRAPIANSPQALRRERLSGVNLVHGSLAGAVERPRRILPPWPGCQKIPDGAGLQQSSALERSSRIGDPVTAPA